MALAVVPLALATYTRNAMWADDLALYRYELERNPYEAGPHLYVGIVYAERGLYEEAAAEFKKTVQIKPGNKTARNNLAHSYLKLGLVDEAIEEYEALRGLDPARFSARFMLGTLYIKKGRVEEARAEFTAALELEPENARVRKLLRYIDTNKVDKIIVK